MTESYYCETCNCKQPFYEINEPRTITVNGKTFSYSHKRGMCIKCYNEIYVPEINDANAIARLDAYKCAVR